MTGGYESNLMMEGETVHELEDEGYDSSLSMRRSTTTDFSSLSLGDSRSSFETEMRSDEGDPDTNPPLRHLNSYLKSF